MAHHDDDRHVGRHRSVQPAQSVQSRAAVVPPGYEGVAARLATEFTPVHPPEVVSRCVCAAQHGAQDVTGTAAPDLVERIARKHLQVLAIVAAERRQRGGLRGAAT